MLGSDPDHINVVGLDVHLSGISTCRGAGAPCTDYDEETEVTAVSGAAFAIRSEVFHALGGFDGNYFLYMEDVDISVRAWLSGYRCLYVPDSLVDHQYHTLRFGPYKTFYQERNRYRVLLKLYRWPTLLLLLPALLLAELVTWGFVLLHDRTRWLNKLQAYGDLFRHWPALKRVRLQAQARRQVSDRHLLRQTTYHLAFEQTGDSLSARLAHIAFDPLFYIWRYILLIVIFW